MGPAIAALPLGGGAIGVLGFGVVLMLLGVALGTGGLPFYIAALAFFLIIDFAFCPYEEGKLEQGCGAAFTSYREHVWRWL